MHPSSGGPLPSNPQATAARVVVATTVALTFISFWRGAAIVLNDLASTMFYIGGIAEHALGRTAPWFVLAVMVFAFAVRSIYLESCGMYVRGGVYVVVREAIGPGMAKFSVSALVVDYVLTGPISSVSAGHYFAGLLNEWSGAAGLDLRVNPSVFATGFALLVTAYFWRQNILGIHESSTRALRIMQVTTVMVVAMLLWCGLTLLRQPGNGLPPAPLPANITFDSHSLGWLEGTFWPSISAAALLIAFGHSMLAMSGFETLAQIYREIAAPKMVNLKRTANLVCIYALCSTGLLSLLAVVIVPDEVRSAKADNLLAALAMSLAGPALLKSAFHAFVVAVGVMVLSGAVNTSIIGANGVLNRVAEDGVLSSWFRRPHRRFGTTSRLIHGVVLLQAATIVASGGDVYLLGEAYAFGVVWSFAFKALAVLALRFQRTDQEYRTPLNLRWAGRELPVGLALTTAMLFLVAVANLLTKQAATVFGLSFTLVLFALFWYSARSNAALQSSQGGAQEEFNLDFRPGLDAETLAARPGCTLVAVRDYTRMAHLRRVLRQADAIGAAVVVATVRPVSGTGAGEHELSSAQLFGAYERELFTRVVALAEAEGKTVSLLTIPATYALYALVSAAHQLQAEKLVTGVSPVMAPEELARRIGLAWERLPEPRHRFMVEVSVESEAPLAVLLGPHAPQFDEADLRLLHEIWLRISRKRGQGPVPRHDDVAAVALLRLQKDLEHGREAEILEDLRKRKRK